MASAPDALPQALSSDDAPAQAAPSDASALLKAALAKKNQAQLYPQRKIHDKGQRPGMAPRYPSFDGQALRPFPRLAFCGPVPATKDQSGQP
ncbi:hypothetical protein ACIUV6_14450 [Pseudomonas aeruginosa]|uniref:hypothetical protein n=1 Tax=Pseudomonas aeruginosa TaxID=287 RepID=UPI000A521738|nr:hypothetical protein [Pseudomonas aeruginosa]MDI3904820.1 hypothetical protein [Pseudomonas aeruginosa]MDI4008220.1 hypothetical protein [Pseudomonas aeruginosa]